MLRLLIPLLFLGAGPSSPKGNDGLAEAYVDGTYRFSIRPPEGWGLDPRRAHYRNETVLLRMFQIMPDNRMQEIKIADWDAPDKTPINELLTRAAHNLELQYSALQIIAQQEQQIAGRPAGYLTASYRRDNAQHLHLEAIIDLGKARCRSIVYVGPSEARNQSEPLFQRVLASLKILSDQLDENELDKAFEAGRAWLASLDEKRIHSRLIPEQVLLMEFDGRPVGFTRIQQLDETLERHPGLRVRERGWLFQPDGRVQRIQNSMFVSYDLKYEKWVGSFTSLVPPAPKGSETLEVRLEEGVRNEHILLSNQAYDMLEPSVANPALTLPDMYLSRALARMMPALIDDLSKQQRMGFLEFDHNKCGLVIRIIDVKGESKLPSGRSREKVYCIDQREGLAAEASPLYVNAQGRIMLAKLGRLSMRAASAAEVEREFAARVSTADLRMNQLEQEYRREEQRFGRQPQP